MNMRGRFVLAFEIAAFLFPFVAQAVDRPSSTALQHVAPTYAIIQSIDKPSIDPGDTVKVDIYLTGTAPIEDHKLMFYIPPVILDGKGQVVSFRFLYYETNAVRPVPPMKTNLSDFMFSIRLSDGYFSYAEGSSNTLLWSEIPLWQKQGEKRTGPSMAPITLLFKTPDAAPPGNHEIITRFFYTAGAESKMAEAKTIIRISSFSERYQVFFVTLCGVLVVLPSLIPEKYRRLLPEKYHQWCWSIGAVVVIYLLWLIVR